MAVASRWALSSLAVQFGKSILLLGSQIVLARLLGPANFGIVAMCAPVFSLCALFNDLGLSQAVIQHPALSDEDSNNIFWINLALGCGLALTLLAAAPLLASFYNDQRVAAVLAGLSVVLVINSLSLQQVALMHRRMQSGAILLIDIGPVVANVVVSVAAAWLNYGYWAIVIGQMTHAIVAGLIAWTLSPFRPARPRALAGTLPLMRFGAHLTGLSLAALAATGLGPLLIGRLFGAAEAGLFDRGYKLVNMSSLQFLTPLSRIAETSLARLGHEPGRYRQAHQQFSGALILFLAPGLVCLALMSGDAVQVLYGSEWLATAPIVSWFAAASLLAPVGAAASWLFVSQGRTQQMLRYGLVGQLLSVLALLLGLFWGTAGAAMASAIVAIPIQAMTLWAATRHGPVSLTDVLDMLLPVGLSVTVSAVVVFMASHQLHQLAFHPLIALGGGLTAAYASAAASLCVTGAGRRIIRNALRAAQQMRAGALKTKLA